MQRPKKQTNALHPKGKTSELQLAAYQTLQPKQASNDAKHINLAKPGKGMHYKAGSCFANLSQTPDVRGGTNNLSNCFPS